MVGHRRRRKWDGRRDGALFGSDGGAEPSHGDGDSYVGGSNFSGIGVCDCGDADNAGDIADYGDGFGCGWGGGRGCGEAYCAVGLALTVRRRQSTAETQRTPRQTFCWGADLCLRLFFIASHSLVLASRQWGAKVR